MILTSKFTLGKSCSVFLNDVRLPTLFQTVSILTNKICNDTEKLMLLVKSSFEQAQLPQRDRAMLRTHFTRDRWMDRWKDGQKAVARTRYAVCVVRKKGLRPKKPTEKIAGQRSYTVGGHRFWYQWGQQMQVFCITEEVNKLETVSIAKPLQNRQHAQNP